MRGSPLRSLVCSLLLLNVFVLSLPGASPEEIPRIRFEIELQWQKEVDEPYENDLSLLHQQYVGAVDRELQSAMQAGDLDSAALLREEKETGAPTSAETGVEVHPALVKLRTAFAVAEEKIADRRHERATAFVGKVSTEIEEKEAALTKAGHIDAGLELREYREQLVARAEALGDATPPEPAWVDLFNGKDLTGWRSADKTLPNNWTVEDGVLSVESPSYSITTERTDFQDFRLRVDCLIRSDSDSGVCFRVQDSKATKAYEAQINGGRSKMPTTGSIVLFGQRKDFPTLAESNQAPILGKWFTMEILAVKNEFTIWVNGEQKVHYIDEKGYYPSPGGFALQCHGASRISFRNIVVQELK